MYVYVFSWGESLFTRVGKKYMNTLLQIKKHINFLESGPRKQLPKYHAFDVAE